MPSPNRSHPLWRMIKILVGVALLVIGFVGLFFPVLQGLLFMLLGLAILGKESRRVRHFLQRLRQRYPGPYERAYTFERRLSRWVMRKLGRKNETEVSGDQGGGGEAP